MNQNPTNILISRTDSIGDVVLTLPMAKALKDRFPLVKISFLGKTYTKAVIAACPYIDEFVDIHDFLLLKRKKPSPWDVIIHVFPVVAIARKALDLRIPRRIGTTSRLYHWHTCNKLLRLTRRKSNLHESQLNLKLLSPFGIQERFPLSTVSTMVSLRKHELLGDEFKKLIDPSKIKVILHPKSQGSAREWGLENFERLVNLLDKERFQIFISGTLTEQILLMPLLEKVKGQITDITGIMDLPQFIAFIAACDALVAASTGPLHLAAALGKKAIGIYPAIKPMHPGRWAPIGPSAVALSLAGFCNLCSKSSEACICMNIDPKEVAERLIN